VSDDSEVRITSSQGTRGRGPWWFPGETLEAKGRRFHFTEHTQTLLVVAGSL
jgi:hypothetical protein